ncbi:hypothetical protein VE03_10654, partial [Pseudogymnoascus sp. 23342-1-I1]
MARREIFPVSITDNGSYVFDRVLKSGYVRKRTRRTKSWRMIYLVLRPASISIYKDEHETKLRNKILPYNLTAVTHYNNPKRKRHNVFCLFSPTRNYLLQALSKPDAREWVELIQHEARIKENDEEMLVKPVLNQAAYSGTKLSLQYGMTHVTIPEIEDCCGVTDQQA